jgi:hypothetical protein
MVRRLALGLALAGGLALPLASAADAAMMDGFIASPHPSDQFIPIEQAQFVFNGRPYCWYDDGWQGPGWYWCGYAYRTGLGWGGGYGWNGWRHGGYGYHGAHHHGGGGQHHGGGGQHHGGGGHKH